jgi:hypothetical protein
LPCALRIERDLHSSAYDGIIVITTSDLEPTNVDGELQQFFDAAGRVRTALYLPTNVISFSSVVILINF